MDLIISFQLLLISIAFSFFSLPGRPKIERSWKHFVVYLWYVVFYWASILYHGLRYFWVWLHTFIVGIYLHHAKCLWWHHTSISYTIQCCTFGRCHWVRYRNALYQWGASKSFYWCPKIRIHSVTCNNRKNWKPNCLESKSKCPMW